MRFAHRASTETSFMNDVENDIFDIIEDDENFFSSVSSPVERLFNLARQDLKLTRFNVQEKALTSSSYRIKWVMIFFKEKSKLKKYKEARVKILKLRTDESCNTTVRGTPRVQVERMVVESNEDIKKLDAAIKESEEIVEFLQHIVNIFTEFGFSVKNSIESIKLSE